MDGVASTSKRPPADVDDGNNDTLPTKYASNRRKRQKLEGKRNSSRNYLKRAFSWFTERLTEKQPTEEPKAISCCMHDISHGFLFMPDGSAPKCKKPLVRDWCFKAEVPKNIVSSSLTIPLVFKQDLQTADAYSGLYGYTHTQKLMQGIGTTGIEFHCRSIDGDDEQCGVMYVSKVPVIKMQCNAAEIRLSDEAINALKEIEASMDSTDQHMYKDFMACFGSHIVVSKITDVGALIECVVVRDFEEPNENILQAVCEAAKTFPNDLEQDAWYPACDFVNADLYTKEELALYRVRVKSICNLTKDIDLNQWKDETLNCDALSTLERTDVKTLSVWELVSQVKDLFENAHILSENLKLAWLDMFKVSKQAIESQIMETDEPEPNDNSDAQVGSDDDKKQEISERENLPHQKSKNNIESQIGDAGASITLEQTNEAEFFKMLKLLHLNEYYPQKISTKQVLELKQFMLETAASKLFFQFLDRLIKIDVKCRENKISVRSGSRISNPQQNIIPTDVILLGYLCSDAGLRQLIASKLFMCRLSISFILPSQNRLTVALWPLRSIVIEWKGVSEASFVKHPMHIMSFMRIGKHTISKSQLLNNLISDSNHPVFFHRERPLGNIKRTVSNGMVEISHYLPGRSPERSIFQNEMALLNLRGDSINHEEQVSVLLKMSSILVIFVCLKDLQRKDILSRLVNYKHHMNGKMILFITNNENINSSYDDLEEVYQQGYEYIPSFYCEQETAMKNTSDITEEMREKICTTLQKLKLNAKSIECHLQSLDNISKDEDDYSGIIQGKKEATNVISQMMKTNKKPSKAMLPLQGKLWKEFSKHQKLMHRPVNNKASSLNDTEKLQVCLEDIRMEQYKLCQNMKPFMQSFIDFFIKHDDEEEIFFFLQWLKLELNEYSRDILPPLRNEYNSKWRAYQNARDAGDDKAAELCKMAKVAENTLFEAGVGVEHLMREIGQAYECSLKCSKSYDMPAPPWMNDLPKVGARLLLSGMPFEIMDGDAGCVPFEWVRDVLKSLCQLIGNKRVFVLSCIGIQSSGKSTLLNTMFGLEFAVGAGRVTRGIYAQLLKVDKAASDLPFDFLIVLDSEGLRAPERAEVNYTNDNELATLVIGLADLTLINIKGENIVEMGNVLEIVCLALVRMQEADALKKLKKQKCIFLHQNVSAVNADEKIGNGHKMLRDKLDERIREVTRMENCDVTSFTQIIAFENDKHASYISDLWNEDPPMAHANIGYSIDVKQIKDKLLEDAMQSRTLTSFIIGLEDIWKAVLSDDFVYNFRNTLCAKAYIEMEIKYASIKRKVESYLLEWLTQSCKANIMGCNQETDLHGCHQKLLLELQQKASCSIEDGVKHLEEYFEKSELTEVLIQWKEDKISCLRTESKLILRNMELELDRYKTAKGIEVKQQNLEPAVELEMIEKATSLAEALKGKNITEKRTVEAFEEMWSKLEADLSPNTMAERADVSDIVQNVLWNKFIDHKRMLNQVLNDKWFTNTNTKLPMQLEDSFSIKDIAKKIHYNERHSSKQSGFGCKSKYDHCVTVYNFLNHVMRIIDTKLDNLLELDMPFHQSIADDMIHTVCESFDDFNNRNESECPIILTMLLKLTIAVHISQMCIPRFEHMNLSYESRHGVKAKITAYKRKVYNLFKNHVHERTEEVKAADLFCDSLVDVVIKAIDSDMSRRIVDAVLQTITIKYHLVVKILESLGNETNESEQFRGYVDYISNPKSYANRWIIHFTKNMIFQCNDGCSQYMAFATNHFDKCMQAILTSVDKATKAMALMPTAKLSHWINEFCKISASVLFAPSNVFGTKQMLNKKVNFQSFHAMVMNRLKYESRDQSLKSLVLGNFDKRKVDDLVWEDVTPYEEIIKHLWGCNEVCPFCHEPCQNSQQYHAENHTCIQHRPIGVRGTRDINSGVLVTETCNFEVSGHHQFNCAACDAKCRVVGPCTSTNSSAYHSFRDYHTYLPDWDIAPDRSGEASPYWQWFMATFSQNLADNYGANEPCIPPSWKKVKKEKAVQSLRKYFN